MARRLPSLNALRAFEAAGRHGLMKLAAEELHVTHSAISRQIQNLEEALGVRLFEGPKNAPRLTDAGRTLLPALSEAFDRIDAAVRLVASAEEGHLDVSCLGTFLMKWLIPRLHRFRQSHPAITIRLSTADTPVDFSRESFDVAIRVGAGPWPEDAEVIPLFAERFGPVCSPKLGAGPDNLFSLPMLQTQTRRSAWSDWCERAAVDVELRPASEFEHFYFMLEGPASSSTSTSCWRPPSAASASGSPPGLSWRTTSPRAGSSRPTVSSTAGRTTSRCAGGTTTARRKPSAAGCTMSRPSSPAAPSLPAPRPDASANADQPWRRNRHHGPQEFFVSGGTSSLAAGW